MPPEPTLSQNPLSIMMSRMSKFAMPSSTPLYHDAIKTVASSDDDSPPARSPNLPPMNSVPGKTFKETSAPAYWAIQQGWLLWKLHQMKTVRGRNLGEHIATGCFLKKTVAVLWNGETNSPCSQFLLARRCWFLRKCLIWKTLMYERDFHWGKLELLVWVSERCSWE